MIKNNIILVAALTIFTAITGCKKDNYIVGGSVQDVNKYKNTTTYDYLKTNPLFDTLVQVIDAAGFKDKINATGTTFFVPTDYSLLNYMQLRTLIVQATINQYSKFALDSLLYYVKNNVRGTRDSLSLYIIGKSLPNDVLIAAGALYPTQLTGDTVAISYEYTRDGSQGYNPVISNVPQLVYFTQLWRHYPITPTNPIDSIVGNPGVIHTLVQSSNLLTQNGVVHVLGNQHTLFFFGSAK